MFAQTCFLYCYCVFYWWCGFFCRSLGFFFVLYLFWFGFLVGGGGICGIFWLCLQLFWFIFYLDRWLIFLASDRFSGAWIRSWHNANTSPLSTGWSVTANTRAPWMSTMTSILQSLSLSGQRPKRSYRKKRTLQRLCNLWGRWVTSCEEIRCQWSILHFLTASAGLWPCLRPDLMDTLLCKKGTWSLGDVRLSCL